MRNHQNLVQKRSNDDLCKESFWINSKATWEKCTCIEWFWWSDDWNSCIKNKEPKELCKDLYWIYAIANNNGLCECNNESYYDKNLWRCVSYTVQCMVEFWELFVSTPWSKWAYCQCKDWYNMIWEKCIKTAPVSITKSGECSKKWWIWNIKKKSCVFKTKQ